MAQTVMMDTGRKTWQAIKPRPSSGPWYRTVNVTENLPMASHIPTGGWYGGYGAVLSHSYAQQFVTTPKESTMPGYWQGGGSAGGTLLGQATRCNGYTGFGDVGDEVIKLQNQYIAQLEAGNKEGAAATKVALDALKGKAEAEKGTDWMDVLTKALEAGTTIYATEVARAEETRRRRRERAGGNYVATQVPLPGGGTRTYKEPTGGGGMNTGTMIGLGVAAAALGLVAWKML
jgi:hypothetical protein